MAIRSPIFSHFEKFEETSTPTIFRAQFKYYELQVSVKGKTTSNLLTHLMVCYFHYQFLYTFTTVVFNSHFLEKISRYSLVLKYPKYTT